MGSANCWILFPLDQTKPVPSSDCVEAIHVAELPSRSGSTKVSIVIFGKQRTKPGPKGPTADLIRAVVEMKNRNPTWGYPQIADQINLAFGTAINKDVVRRILALHYQPEPGASAPS